MSKHQNQFSSKIISMGILEISLISFLVTLYSPVFSSASSGNDEHCSSFFCGSDPTFVRYPFKFLNQSKKECGIPGFDLGCDSGENISLNLPNSGEFSVRYINYYNQGIQLRDPQGCLPGRLLKLLSNSSTSSPFSPFSGDYFDNYTFFRCRNYSNPLWNPTLPIITCLSNPDAFVIASSASDFAIGMPSLCNLIGSVSVPQSRTGAAAAADIAADDFTLSLSWKDPDCLHCIARGGFCRFAGKTVCTINEASSRWKRWEKFLKIVGFSIFLPLAILPVFFFTVLLCLGGFRRRGDRRRNLAGSSRALRVAEMIRQLTAKPGLDERVIESYPKMVVDERLGNVGRDVMCCICLDEYVAGEMLRSLPECRHCFHAECIDEWLKINRTCPICRI